VYELGNICGYKKLEVANESVSHIVIVCFCDTSGTYTDHGMTVGDREGYLSTKFVSKPGTIGYRYIFDPNVMVPPWASGKQYRTYEDVVEMRVWRHVHDLFLNLGIVLKHTNTTSLMGSDGANVCFQAVVTDLCICHDVSKLRCCDDAGPDRQSSCVDDALRTEFIDGWRCGLGTSPAASSPKEMTNVVRAAVSHLACVDPRMFKDANDWAKTRGLNWGQYDGVCDVCGCKDYDDVNAMFLCEGCDCQCSVHVGCRGLEKYGVEKDSGSGGVGWWCPLCAEL
jgi:hypothetical protein